MRKILFIVLLLVPLFASARGISLSDHAKIREHSSFRLLGAVDLREGRDTAAPVKYRTLNHEMGMNVTVLELLQEDVRDGSSGRWLYVLLTEPMWVESGEWIEKYRKFLLFLPDDAAVCDFEP